MPQLALLGIGMQELLILLGILIVLFGATFLVMRPK